MTGALPFSKPQTLMALWVRNRDTCRAVGSIVCDARQGLLAGVEPCPSGFGFRVTDMAAALSAMRQER